MKTIVDERPATQDPPDYTLDATPGAVCVSHSDIANLAYRLWEERGCPENCADDNWFEAEQRLIGKKA